MEEFLSRILAYYFVLDIFDILIGTSICYGALKWRRGLITTVAFYWGLIIGAMIGIAITYSNMMYNYSSVDATPLILCLLAGGVVFPILTYSVPGVNRFVLGFIVVVKLSAIITTVAAREAGMDISTAIVMPLIAGTGAGLFFMAWTKIRVAPFVIACAFFGASQSAPKLAKYTQQILFGITGDSRYLPGIEDIIAGLFKVELTDIWTLIWMAIFMGTGIRMHFKSVIEQGYSLDTPLITYETEIKEKHGKIYSSPQ